MSYILRKIAPLRCEAIVKDGTRCEFTETHEALRYEIENADRIGLCTGHARQLERGKPVVLVGGIQVVPDGDRYELVEVAS